MRKINIILCLSIFISIIFTNCEGDKRKIKDLLDSSGQTIESNEQPETLKQVEWRDGKTYSYDYTEIITIIDSLGNQREITVYKGEKPKESDIICDKEICKWCSKEVYAENYEITEHPDMEWKKKLIDYCGNDSRAKITVLFALTLFNYDGYVHYYDMHNNKIRTEWSINCNYPGPDGFCSLKCENEYNNR
jgi:hypothetical protein